MIATCTQLVHMVVYDMCNKAPLVEDKIYMPNFCYNYIIIAENLEIGQEPKEKLESKLMHEGFNTLLRKMILWTIQGVVVTVKIRYIWSDY